MGNNLFYLVASGFSYICVSSHSLGGGAGQGAVRDCGAIKQILDDHVCSTAGFSQSPITLKIDEFIFTNMLRKCDKYAVEIKGSVSETF